MPHTDADPRPGRKGPSGDAPREASPLEVFPELASLASVLADAVVVTDVHRRVAAWNDAAIALYGIDRTDAIGTVIDDLFDSTIIGEGIDSSVARGLTLEHGSWRGRVADVPRLGRRAGDELVIETVLSRLDRPDGTSVGVISVKRDITAGVRLEREIATLSSLATATGEARSRTAFAERAIEVLTNATGAAHGAIVIAHGDAGRVLAARGLSTAMATVTVDVPWADAPAIRAIGTVGRVLRGAVERLPLLPTTRRAFLDEGIQLMVAVGLHREDELIGLLTLGWHDADAVIPSDAMWSLVATTLARGMENARLVEEIVRRADLERQTTVRLRALDDLTRVVETATSMAELAERSARIIDQALGASGTAYGLLAADGATYATSSLVRVPPAVADWLYANQPDVRTAFRRWRNGEGAFLEAFEPGIVSREMVELARTAGLTGYAAIPIRVDDTLVGGVASYFDRPMADLRLDRSTLDRVATVLSASLTTFRLRERLADADRRYRTLLDSSPDALFVELLDGTILEANDAAQAIFRADGPWLIGRRPLDLAVYDDPRPRHLTRALAVGASFRVQSIGIRRDGEHFPQEVDVRRVDLDGEPRLLVRIRDLTDQERLQAELIQAQKMESTGQLVSGVAHELNNPLASILGFSQLIRRDAALPEDLRHNADLLVEEASRTRRIVQNLLDFAGQRPPERYPTAIATLVDTVVALQSYSLGPGAIRLEVAIDADLPLVELDRNQLQQVLVNLTQNAVYAVREGGGSRVRIGAVLEPSASGDRVRVTVMDDGPGVPPEYVERLFEAFFTTKPPTKGTGLGLPVSYGIIRSHGGELRYQPSAFGRGAAFTFDLPVRAAPIDRPAVSATPTGLVPNPAPATVPLPSAPTPTNDVVAAAGPPARPRILVLDDEPAIRVFLTKALGALGFEAVPTASGKEAIEAAKVGEYAAFLVDHQMAGMSGLDVYEVIVSERPDYGPRFVVMSGDVLNPALERFAAATGIEVLGKPFDLDTLDRTIRALVGGQARG